MVHQVVFSLNEHSKMVFNYYSLTKHTENVS